MRIGRRIGMVVGTAAAVVFATPSLAHAALSITVPSSVNLGSVPSGTASLSGQLGGITVTTSLTPLTWTATVSATDFTSGSATIAKASLSYWSGPVTASSGIGTRTPGQLTAQLAVSLSTPRTAFAVPVALVTTSTTWNPTIVVAIPAAAVAGTYSGTITHSVA